MKVAYIHDWLDTYRGGEKVLEAMLELYQDAPVYTMFFDPALLPNSITSRKIFYPKWCRPFNHMRKALLPLYPRIVENYDLSSYDLILSSSSCAAKGVIPRQGAKHLCYIHSPMRYIWDQQKFYFQGVLQKPIINQLANWEAERLRKWDVKSASKDRVHRFVANSSFVRQRVKEFYSRDSAVIHPPIEDRFFHAELPKKKDDYVIAAGALVPYKRFDLAIAACKKANKRLIIAGDGPEAEKISKSLGPNMQLITRPDDHKMQELLANAQALLFPGVEDFGMIPIETMALGTPVIAFARGGALDYVTPGETGVLVESEDPQDWADVIASFNDRELPAIQLRTYAKKFSRQAFQDSLRREIALLLEES